MASIVEVSRLAGVSYATVSNVINSKPGVSAETVRKVKKAMKQLGYIPAPRARRTGPRAADPGATARTYNIGAAFVGERTSWLSYPIHARLLEDAQAVLMQKGYACVLAGVQEPTDKGVFTPAKMDGMLLFGLCEDLIECVNIPVVSVLGHPDPARELASDHVEPANDRAGVLAARYLIERGHKKVMVFDPATVYHDAFQKRVSAFATCCAARGVECEVKLLPFTERKAGQIVDFNVLDNVVEFVDGFSEAQDRATAFFIPTDTHMVVLYKALQSRGIVPGQDVELIGCNNETSLLEGLERRPATIDIDTASLARCAVERLLYRIEHGADAEAAVIITVQPKLVPADSGVREVWD